MKKINVIWLVNEKFTNNFLSFYKLCNQKNSKINITIFAVPHIGLTSSKEISEYLSANGIDNIDCYNKSTKQYVDIKKYKPDYVFYTTPYNIYVPDDYKSKIVSKYAKVCCVSYGACVIRTNGLYKDLSKNTFIDDCYKIFVESKYSMLHSNKNKYKILGYMKLDNYTDIQENLRKKVIWKPRWTLEEGDSNFFEYFDCLYNYFVNHPDFDFSIYFHPLFESKIREKNMKKNLKNA